jgi:peptidoglycan/xylan/chitin deacetylase (PgdA/CDA1 family)
MVKTEHAFDEFGICSFCGYIAENNDPKAVSEEPEEEYTRPERITVLYGRYEQDNNTENGPEPIEWYLLDASGRWINENKIIYLTFDDGPGPYTDRLLTILDKYNVKATFFVTGAYPSYSYCIGKAYNAGHSIGVHTYTHNYNQIYASESAYWSDFEKIQNLIASQTGSRTNLVRFPGGSSNMVSKINPGIMTRLTKSMNSRGYTYFDWNVISGDAGETTCSTGVYNYMVKGVQSHTSSVVLCHDIKSYTVDAMEDFIPWAQSNGYTFLPLTTNSPTAHQTVQN